MSLCVDTRPEKNGGTPVAFWGRGHFTCSLFPCLMPFSKWDVAPGAPAHVQEKTSSFTLFCFGACSFPFSCFLCVLDFSGVFNGPIGPGTPEVKTLRNHVKKSFFILKIYYGGWLDGIFFNFKASGLTAFSQWFSLRDEIFLQVPTERLAHVFFVFWFAHFSSSKHRVLMRFSPRTRPAATQK